VLGVVCSGGRTRWLPELSCRVRDGASTWVDASAARLNELLAAAAGDAGNEHEGREAQYARHCHASAEQLIKRGSAAMRALP